MQRVSTYVCFVLILLIGVSCSKFRKIEKSQDWRVKYDAGLNYYNNKKDYYKASVLFEQIIPIVRGLPEGEKVQFYLAYCQFYDKLYLLASEQFKTFYETYGRSSMAEEARFMYAYSLYESSPNPNLDQTSSIDAMDRYKGVVNHYKEFVDKYPSSSYLPDAEKLYASSLEKINKSKNNNS